MTRHACAKIGIVLCVVLMGTPAVAHLTGVFAHFVEDINDPTASTRMLRQQLDSVRQRLAALEPEVQAARMAYDVEAEAAVRRIRFYDIYAGSALGALWAGAQDPIDVIASTELLQRRLGDDLDAPPIKAIAPIPACSCRFATPPRQETSDCRSRRRALCHLSPSPISPTA